MSEGLRNKPQANSTDRLALLQSQRFHRRAIEQEVFDMKVESSGQAVRPTRKHALHRTQRTVRMHVRGRRAYVDLRSHVIVSTARTTCTPCQYGRPREEGTGTGSPQLQFLVHGTVRYAVATLVRYYYNFLYTVRYATR